MTHAAQPDRQMGSLVPRALPRALAVPATRDPGRRGPGRRRHQGALETRCVGRRVHQPGLSEAVCGPVGAPAPLSPVRAAPAQTVDRRARACRDGPRRPIAPGLARRGRAQVRRNLLRRLLPLRDQAECTGQARPRTGRVVPRLQNLLRVAGGLPARAGYAAGQRGGRWRARRLTLTPHEVPRPRCGRHAACRALTGPDQTVSQAAQAGAGPGRRGAQPAHHASGQGARPQHGRRKKLPRPRRSLVLIGGRRRRRLSGARKGPPPRSAAARL